MQVVWRPATAADWPRIQELHAEIEQKLGKKMDLPEMDAQAVLLYLVAEKEGVVTQFGYFERAIEWCMGGEDVESLQSLIGIADEVLGLAKSVGVRYAHTFVPQEMAENIGRHLGKAGFQPNAYAAFRADLR